MKKGITYLMTLVVVTHFAACDVSDKGNYDYTPINDITITGINTSYARLAQVENLEITPTITSTLDADESNFAYNWFFCSGDDHVHTQIGTQKDLNWEVNVNPGIYTLFFEVIDKTTGMKWNTSTQLTVTTNYTNGFLLLGTEPGTKELRMDMIMIISSGDTIVGERVYPNEIGLRNPQRIVFTGAYGMASADANKALYLLTDECDAKITSGTYFTDINDFNSLNIIETELPHISPMRVKDLFPSYSYAGGMGYRARSERGYITEDMIVMNSIIQVEYFSTPINRYSPTSTQLFRPYPLAFLPGSARYNYCRYPIFYDMDSNCFVSVGPNATASSYSTPSMYNIGSCQKMTDRVTDPFPWDQAEVGRTIVYGENGYYGSYGDSYALMKDQEDNYCVYVFQSAIRGTFAAYTPTKKGYYPIEAMAVDFDRASHYAFMSSKSVIVYSVGSMLYAYDYARQQFTSLDLGDEITCLKVEYASTQSMTAIIVATYNEGTQEGVVRKLDIGGGNNAVTIEERPNEVWPVTMPVIDIVYKYSVDNQYEMDLLDAM